MNKFKSWLAENEINFDNIDEHLYDVIEKLWTKMNQQDDKIAELESDLRILENDFEYNRGI